VHFSIKGSEIMQSILETEKSVRKSSRGRVVLTWGLSIVLFLINLIYFLMRDWEASYLPSNYATMYYPTERPVIVEWSETPSGIRPELSWSVPVEGWRIEKEGEFYAEVSGRELEIPLKEDDTDMRSYEAIPLPEGIADSLELQIRYLPESFHINRGLPRPDNYLFITDIPTGKFKQFSVADWVDRFEYLPKEDLQETERLLREEADIYSASGTLEKLERLMVFMRESLGKECRGTPPADFRWKTPFQIYEDMRDGTGQGWCTQHAQMFVYFANRAGLSTRIVQGASTQENTFIHTGHTWLEAWVPEQGRWAWVDPSPALCYALDKKGQVLNTYELAQLRQHDAWDGVTVRVYKDWQWPDIEGADREVVDGRMEEVGGVIERQFVTSAIYKWRRPPLVEDIRDDYTMLFKNGTFARENFIRYYFRPPLALANFPTEGKQTYWIRHLLLWPFVISLVSAIWFTLRRRRV
jgi:hypothetical protein